MYLNFKNALTFSRIPTSFREVGKLKKEKNYEKQNTSVKAF